MRLFEDSLAMEILSYLNKNGEVPRKSLYIPFSSYAYKYYARTVKRLIDEGYIDLFKYNRIYHVRLSTKGYNELRNKVEDSKEVEGEKFKSINKRDKKRKGLVSSVTGLLEGCGIQFEDDDKPVLVDLFDDVTGPGPDKEKKLFVDSLSNGIFYTTGDIRKAYIARGGGGEVANWSRLIGVLLKDSRAYFIYNTNDKLIKWVSSSEERTVSTIVNFLKTSSVISSNIYFPTKPICIVCGKGYSMIPKLIYGRKSGKRTEDINLNNYQAYIAKNQINTHNISKVFSVAYYIPLITKGVEMLSFVIMLDEETKDNVCDEWFNSVGTAKRVKGYKYHQGRTPNGARVVYMPYIDLIELEYYKNQGVEIHFVIPTGTQEAIARVMGPLVKSTRNLKGAMLRHKTYDAGGGMVENA